jgi:hypothetical protein
MFFCLSVCISHSLILLYSVYLPLLTLFISVSMSVSSHSLFLCLFVSSLPLSFSLSVFALSSSVRLSFSLFPWSVLFARHLSVYLFSFSPPLVWLSLLFSISICLSISLIFYSSGLSISAYSLFLSLIIFSQCPFLCCLSLFRLR